MFTIDPDFIVDVMVQTSYLIQELAPILEFIFGLQIFFWISIRIIRLLKFI
jgi:hypothetical protein